MGKRGRKPYRTDEQKLRGKRSRRLKFNFGITLDEYETMLAQQAGVCAICKAPPETSYCGTLAVDHDHDTGKVRGLLCTRCNTALGSLRDSPEMLRAAANYLERTA